MSKKIRYVGFVVLMLAWFTLPDSVAANPCWADSWGYGSAPAAASAMCEQTPAPCEDTCFEQNENTFCDDFLSAEETLAACDEPEETGENFWTTEGGCLCSFEPIH